MQIKTIFLDRKERRFPGKHLLSLVLQADEEDQTHWCQNYSHHLKNHENYPSSLTLALDSTCLLFAFICFGFSENTFIATFPCEATFDFIFLVCNASILIFGVSVKTSYLPGLRPFLIDSLNYAFLYDHISSRDSAGIVAVYFSNLFSEMSYRPVINLQCMKWHIYV